MPPCQCTSTPTQQLCMSHYSSLTCWCMLSHQCLCICLLHIILFRLHPFQPTCDHRLVRLKGETYAVTYCQYFTELSSVNGDYMVFYTERLFVQGLADCAFMYGDKYFPTISIVLSAYMARCWRSSFHLTSPSALSSFLR
jgi:hypothetical protein